MQLKLSSVYLHFTYDEDERALEEGHSCVQHLLNSMQVHWP